VPLRDNAPKGAEPVVTILLILACCIAFVIQLAYPGGFFQSILDWGEVPKRILAGESVPGTNISAYWTWLSNMFLHAGPLHLFGNMLMLWLVGDNVEWLMGRLRFVVFYLACGLASSLATTYIGAESELPGVGASGALAGVMAAYLIYYPRARITSVFWVNPLSFFHLATGDYGIVTRNISALWYIGSWVVLEIVLGSLLLGHGVQLNLGIYAHAAGAIAGALLCWPLVIQSRRPHPEDPVNTDELTLPFVGDEGDGGSGERYVTLSEELARLKGSGSYVTVAAEPVDDWIADELEAKGDVRGALAHCREMLRIAQQREEHSRAAGYRARIAELERVPIEAAAVGPDIGI
jgi:membrane associated rhomboid family serine protease